jgi:SAM-dependent methyltransferase
MMPPSSPLRCRICAGTDLEPFLSLGVQPHCNSFLHAEQLSAPEPVYPLDAYFCRDCALVQLGHAVSRETMFADHPYVSGTTATLTSHFHDLAARLCRQHALGPGALVVDIGSNDGTWLQGFRQCRVHTLGVEPAKTIADIAERSGIETVRAFFGRETAEAIVATHGRADLVTAAGVFFHVDDLDDFMQGVTTLLQPGGAFVVQAMYLLDIVEKTAFDAIYHEHLCYYSLAPLVRLFARYGLAIARAERSSIHGGSFVIEVMRRTEDEPAPQVAALLDCEAEAGLYRLETFRAFGRRTRHIREALTVLLANLRKDGRRIAAYGASARGNTLLNYCGIGPDTIEYAVEKNPLKVGFYTPGSRIPVISEAEAATRVPDYFLVLPWNFLDEFLRKEQPYRARGGKFIVPVPEPRIV